MEAAVSADSVRECPLCGSTGNADFRRCACGCATRPPGWQHAESVEPEYQVLSDQPDLGLRKGDILECIPYWANPNQLRVLRRVNDGSTPNINIYRSRVNPVRR